ncbi:hypothetical protein [Pseudomonas phage D6]|nr:hypothetical protein [Pseudomonas phage D6]
MAALTKQQMLGYIQAWFDKIEAGGVGGGKFRYITGSVPANGTVVYDAPTVIGYNSTTHNIYSIGVDLRMVDPFTATNPPVIQATAVLDFAIASDGKVTIRNNHTAAVTYHARITEPVKK